MKNNKFSQSLFVLLAASAILTLAPSTASVYAQSQTETKIRLMAEALRARDAGDLDAAKKSLEELLILSPNDTTVQRLLSGVNAAIEARSSGVVQAPPPPSVPAEPVEVSFSKPNSAKAADVPAVVRETASASQSQQVSAPSEKPVANVELVDPQAAAAAAERAEVDALVAKGRGQYLAGDIEGAQETFRAVEIRAADNAAAKSFLARIARGKSAVAALNREKTRSQMVEQVAKSWQLAGIYQDAQQESAEPAEKTAIANKLSSIQIPSINFSGAPLSKVVSTLTKISEQYDTSDVKGLNIVLVDPTNKNPTVTLTVSNLSLKRVLDFITDQIGYQYEIQPDAVIVRPGGDVSILDTAFFPVTRATVIRMTGVSPASAAPAAAADPFAAAPAASATSASGGGEAQALQAFLQQAGVNFAAVQGSSLAYDGAAIIVTQTKRNIDRIRNILNRYNEVRQVEIEAKFIEVQEGVLDELGVNWNVTHGRNGNPNYLSTVTSGNRNLATAFASQNSTTAGSIVRPATPDTVQFTDTDGDGFLELTTVPGVEGINQPIINNPPAIPGSVDIASGASALGVVTGVLGDFNIEATVRALSRKTGADLLSAPKVTVLSGNPANIVIAQELRYPQSYGEIQSQVGTGAGSALTGSGAGVTITAGTPQEFTSRNVGVELKVTPTVEEDDYSISLDLNPKVTEFEGFVEYGGQSVAISGGTTVTVPSGFYQPVFSTREITTKVTVWDGATLVMGGLTREEVKKVNDKVPVLGDIPLIGRAFRSKGETSQKRNLLIFVTANLVSPGGSPKRQSLKNVQANSIFQNPSIVSPAGSESRVRGK